MPRALKRGAGRAIRAVARRAYALVPCYGSTIPHANFAPAAKRLRRAFFCCLRQKITVLKNESIHTRIAPTPSGFLHLGNLFSFVLTWLLARSSEGGGRLHLRIDDIDATRTRAAYVQDIFETLHWLGLDWDTGARDAADFYLRHSQQLRLGLYEAQIEKLAAAGALINCACTRKSLEVQPCTCPIYANEKGENGFSVLRLDTSAHPILEHHAQMRRLIVRTREGRAAYMLVSVVEDVREGVNFLVRGSDLLLTTAAQRFLAQKMGGDWAKFEQVAVLHHPLLLQPTGEKLSKSAGATSVQTLRERYTRAAFFRFVAHNLGLGDCDSLEKLRYYFSPAVVLPMLRQRSKLDHTF